MRNYRVAIVGSPPEEVDYLRGEVRAWLRDRVEIAVREHGREAGTVQEWADLLLVGGDTHEDAFPGQRKVAVTYSLTRMSYAQVGDLPFGACLRIPASGEIRRTLGAALANCGRPDLALYPGRGIDTGAGEGVKAIREDTREALRLDPPFLSVGTLSELLWRLGVRDEATLDSLAQYASRAELTHDELVSFLDKRFIEPKWLISSWGWTDRAVLILDVADYVVEAGGFLKGCLSREAEEIVGLPVQEVLPFGELRRCYGQPGQEFPLQGPNGALGGSAVPLGSEGTALWLRRVEVEAPDAEDKGSRSGASREAPLTFSGIVGQSTPIRRAKDLAARFARSEFPVLLVGESGTGKELFAQGIHNESFRSEEPFITVNCAAVPEGLIESELFGYAQGAFTGANRGGKESPFERAQGGTVFLDEVGELSPKAQAALLRILETGEVVPVGGSEPRYVDVRIVAATNRPLEGMLEEGGFRLDLYHRLCAFPIQIPPLRDRPGDIPELAHRYLGRKGEKRPLPQGVLETLTKYDWPGNVRELEHALEYMIAVTDEAFTRADLPPYILSSSGPSSTGWLPTGFNGASHHTFPGGSTEGQDSREPHTLQPEEQFLLQVLGEASRSGKGLGRRELAHQASRAGFELSEGSIRTRLESLRQAGLIECARGRKGTRLTPEGFHFLAQMEAFPESQ